MNRAIPIPIVDFAGSEVKGSGKAISLPLRLRHGNHHSVDIFEVGPLDRETDIILPYWWLQAHQPSGFWESSVAFDSQKCRQQCTKRGLADFSLVYDESVLQEEPSAIGIIA